ncbi:UDP-N-acetylmuramoylalanyl-D-glutamyl-2,6-diaminopimelate--D-alanyl-D-alanine ligase [Xanthobacter autotrophicus]|uniref:UDP-N-acetylmuramoylalanyl-D-glutamyl-2, 6-diaminopimelate--D-alanyl-D-alanine ligase n=1 Tax=Xanthobacter autotrophicus TaxID=280 RepID=UPI0024A6BC75|nr:UDP-N-acetylmuramoylalanyl-D-glutamyl-2,6-diaminopimelate--D-alanyl-D-alanine ligase [Xanthobacter autotrophicus]MDI4656487.1 UDP-N-acetylmuramoylalanyl-D-glutamyl-2,6-diaminopimelate--D-alanyl-D-alanine ligase [Xanthobacter autotrophicus]
MNMSAGMSGRVLHTVAEMAEATGAAVRGTPRDVTGISIDSRTLAPGDAFFAITGENSDGHAYVEKALATGAALAVVARDRADAFPEGAPLLVVDDVLAALTDVARAARARSQAQIVAVTGSVGKTTTKEALRIALGADGETHASAASYNNHWGVPLSLARFPREARYGVFEIGMNHPGEITPLVRLVRPHVAIVTTVEPVHIAQFASIEEIADAKAEIFDGVEPGGAAVLNLDNPLFDRLKAAAEARGISHIVSFGSGEGADVRLKDAALKSYCSVAVADVMGTPITFKVGMPGRHIVQNMLAVLAAARLAGADMALAALALSHLKPPPGRGVPLRLQVKSGQATLLDESYNANPASMRAALDVLSRTPVGTRGRRIAVLGDMLELGPDGEAHHAGLATAIVAAKIDQVYCCGPQMHALWQALPSDRRGGYAIHATHLEPMVAAAIRAGDTLMVKGSNGSRMGPLVKKLAERFHAGEDALLEG